MKTDTREYVIVESLEEYDDEGNLKGDFKRTTRVPGRWALGWALSSQVQYDKYTVTVSRGDEPTGMDRYEDLIHALWLPILTFSIGISLGAML